MSVSAPVRLLSLFAVVALPANAVAVDGNALVLEAIRDMPAGGVYGRYQRDLPESRRFDSLYATVDELQAALEVGLGGRLRVDPSAAGNHSFCSSATYLLFCRVIERLQREGLVPANRRLSRELADVGGTEDVIHGRLDGVGLFGHWNANGPGTAVLFHRLGLGPNFSSFDEARPGDFLKIFWNDKIGKGERGHLVVYLGANEAGDKIEVWSSNLSNEDGSAGYGTMWIDKSRIQRAVFSRLEHPENLVRWLDFSESEKTSDYLVRILKTGSTVEEMHRVTGVRD